MHYYWIKLLQIPFPLQIAIGLLVTFFLFGLPFSLKYKDYFFGWNNIKKLIIEVLKMYSNKPSFFSYKRFQMGVAFFLYTQGSLWALSNIVQSMGDFVIWAGLNLTIAGYTLNQVQKEKKEEPKPDQ